MDESKEIKEPEASHTESNNSAAEQNPSYFDKIKTRLVPQRRGRRTFARPR